MFIRIWARAVAHEGGQKKGNRLLKQERCLPSHEAEGLRGNVSIRSEKKREGGEKKGAPVRGQEGIKSSTESRFMLSRKKEKGSKKKLL